MLDCDILILPRLQSSFHDSKLSSKQVMNLFRDTMVKQSTLFMYIKFIGISIIGMLFHHGFNYMFVNEIRMYYLLAAFILVIASGVNFVLNTKITFGIRLQVR